MEEHFSDLVSNLKHDKELIALLQQMIALFVYFNRSDKPEYKCLENF